MTLRPLVLLLVAGSLPGCLMCDSRPRGWMTMIAGEDGVELAEPSEIGLAPVVSSDGQVAAQASDGTVVVDGSATSTAVAVRSLIAVGSRFVSFDVPWNPDDPSVHNLPFLRDPFSAVPEQLLSPTESYGGVVGADGERIVLVVHGRSGSTTGPLTVLSRDPGGEWEVRETGVTADWTPLAVAMAGDRIAFATYLVGDAVTLFQSESGEFTEVGTFEVFGLYGALFGGDDQAWFAAGGGGTLRRPAPIVFSTGGCELEIPELHDSVGLTRSDEGVTAWGFTHEGAPARAEVVDCLVTFEEVGERIGRGDPKAVSARSGSRAVVEASFVDDGETFTVTEIPPCY